MTLLPDAQLYIDGKLRDAAGGRTFDIIGPWTGEVVGKAADASAADVEEAIAAARRAFDESDWSTNIALRVELVTKLRDLFVANKDRLSDLARHEAGAALGAVGRAHVDMALEGWDDYLRVFPQVEWEVDYGTRETYGFTSHRKAVREPVGVVGAIIAVERAALCQRRQGRRRAAGGLHRDPQARAQHAGHGRDLRRTGRCRRAFRRACCKSSPPAIRRRRARCSSPIRAST